MQTIRITITSEKPAAVVLTERKPGLSSVKKKTSGKKLQELFELIPKLPAITKPGGGEQLCD